jgi:hypothetical protein
MALIWMDALKHSMCSTQNTASFKKWFTLGNLSYLSEWKKVFMFLTIPSRTKVHLYQVYQNVK